MQTDIRDGILRHEAEIKWVTTAMSTPGMQLLFGSTTGMLGKSKRRAQRRNSQDGHMLGRVLVFLLTAQAGQGTVTNTGKELLLIAHSSPGIN